MIYGLGIPVHYSIFFAKNMHGNVICQTLTLNSYCNHTCNHTCIVYGFGLCRLSVSNIRSIYPPLTHPPRTCSSNYMKCRLSGEKKTCMYVICGLSGFIDFFCNRPMTAWQRPCRPKVNNSENGLFIINSSTYPYIRTYQ